MSIVQSLAQMRTIFQALFAALAAFAAVSAQAAPAEDAFSTLPRITPGEVGRGSLLLRPDAGDGPPRGFRLAPLVATEVEITVGGMVARAVVRQHFRNPSAEWVEGMSVFPLPENAAVDHLRLIVGDRLIDGLIKERAEARRIYEVARQQGKKAGLLESERPNIFTTSIANIGPGEHVAIEIEYQQSLAYDQGGFSLRFPMVVGPRYNPGAIQSVSLTRAGWAVQATDQVPDAGRISAPVLRPEQRKINPVTLSIDLAPGFPITDIDSPYHAITLSEAENGSHHIELGEGAVPADRDFQLSWRPAAGSAPIAGLFTEAFHGEYYLLAMVLPPDPSADAAATVVPPREVIFVLDISGSMGGQSIRQAKAALALAIDRLDDQDRFNLVIFNHTASALFALYHRAECLTHVGDSQAVRSLTQCGEPMRFAMAAPIDLRNDFDSVSLRRLAKRTRDATQSRRLLALAEVYDGGSRTDASRIGGVGLQIIRDWVLRFNARGPDGLVDGKSPGAPSKLNADHRRALAEVVEAGPVPAVDGVVRWRRKDLARWLLETFAISLDETTVGRELKALGFAKISARPRHYAQNELAVEAFKKNFPAELAKIRARLPKGVEIELWWQDEARIGQKNKLTRRWARRGTRPRAPRDQRTEWAYIFGAICPAKGKGAGLVMPWCDTDAMAAHLIEISAAVDPGAHAVLIVDQAGWHLTPKLAIPDNITVLALPPRSPELNPVENVWQFMRDNWLSNRIFKSYEDIVALCCQAWNNLIDQPWKIMSLGMRKWAHGF